MPTIEERALALVNEVRAERSHPPIHSSFIDRDNYSFSEALCREIETLDAERAAHAQFRQEVSDVARDAVAMLDEMAKPLLMGRNVKERLEKARSGLAPLIIAKPDPMMHLAREMVLPDGVVRTDSQKAAIREGRAANTAADDFYDRLRTALPARGLKLVEVGDAD
jgi:hypothetical protein